MGTLQPDSECKSEMNDSGCVQDESPPVLNGDYFGCAQLLDLSDDVLLFILQHCRPCDLKALAFTCPRLSALVRDRTLWQRVDARAQSSGKARVKWLLSNVSEGTTELHLCGYARQAKGCLGHSSPTQNQFDGAVIIDDLCGRGTRNDDDESPRRPPPLSRQHARLHLAPQLPRYSSGPTWSEEYRSDTAQHACAGPQFTLSGVTLSQLTTQCPKLTTLSLEYCNIDCLKTKITDFPPTLRRLSLRGTNCYNLPHDKSYLFKIQDHIPDLEYLDVSECTWMEPAALMPLSKAARLHTLLMRDCPRVTEFVAYASLATRYGFRTLKELDFRGSPLGDSEVSALGWLPALERLRLSVPATAGEVKEHSHVKGEPLKKHQELDAWEIEESSTSDTEDIPEGVNDELKYTKIIVDNGLRHNGAGDGPHNPENRVQVENTSRIENTLREPIENKRRLENPIEAHSSDREGPVEKKLKNEERNSIDRPVEDVVEKEECKDKDQKDRGPSENKEKPIENKKRPIEDEEPSSSKRSRPDDRNERSEQNKRSERNERSERRRSEDNQNRSRYTIVMKFTNPDSQVGSSTVKRKNEGSRNNDNEAGSSKNSGTKSEQKTKEIDEEKPGKSNSNENASNTNEQKPNKSEKDESDESDSSDEEPKKPAQRYVQFRRNEPPVAFVCPHRNEPNIQNHEPIQPILYISVSHQGIYSPVIHNHHVDVYSLVSDSALRMFGSADNEDVNFVHIGPNFNRPGRGVLNGRPERSNLRYLEARGYRHITDRSLEHLATAAPHLMYIDFRGTSVTERGVENFKNLRPDCEVRFGKDE